MKGLEDGERWEKMRGKKKGSGLLTSSLLVGELGGLLVNNNLLVAAACCRRIRQQLHLAQILERQKPPRRIVGRLAHRQEAMVLQNNGLVGRAQRLGNANAFLTVEDDAAKVLVDGMLLIETQRVLCNYLELTTKG